MIYILFLFSFINVCFSQLSGMCRVIFVTRKSMLGNFGATEDPFSVADRLCLDEVNSVYPQLIQNNEWKAWLSTSKVYFLKIFI